MLTALIAACAVQAAAATLDLTELRTAAAGVWRPAAWEVRAVRGQRAPDAAVLDSANDHFLRLRGESRAAFFVRRLATPIPATGGRLQLRWRIPVAPIGADMRMPRTDDSPLRVFVVFQTSGFLHRTPRTLFYSSGIAEPPTYSGRGASSEDVHVIRITSAATSSAWTESSLDPAADYARVWGSMVPCIVAFGLMQDSDQTGSAAVADLHHLFWRPRDVPIR
jgi:Protein of unknown function (DUF3047)